MQPFEVGCCNVRESLLPNPFSIARSFLEATGRKRPWGGKAEPQALRLGTASICPPPASLPPPGTGEALSRGTGDRSSPYPAHGSETRGPHTSRCRGDLAGAFSPVHVCWESRERVGGGRTGMCVCVFVGVKLLEISYRRVFRNFNCLFVLEVTNIAVSL